MKPKIMIKYGKEEHLKQIIDGKLRFNLSQTYVTMEQLQHNKGQGDLLEGKIRINIEKAEMRNPNTNEVVGILPKGEIVMGSQDVNNMPIFCISQYDDSVVKFIDDTQKIIIPKDNLDCIKKDFKEATHALIVLEPEKFVDSVRKIEGHKIICNEIYYYDYDNNPLQMYMYLTTGDTKFEKGVIYSMTYENRYRHLLCKDIDFIKQQEYRFIVLDELIDKPKFYDFLFDSQYMLVPIESLEQPLEIEL